MGKRKKSEQPFFIDFANCEFERKALLSFTKKTLKRFYPDRDFSNVVKSLLNKDLFQRCFQPSQKFFSEIIEKDFLSGLKSKRDPYSYNEREQYKLNYLSEKMELSKEDLDTTLTPYDDEKDYDHQTSEAVETKKDFDHIYEMGFFHFALKKILEKVICNEKLEEGLLSKIEGYYNYGRTRLIFGRDTYLRKQNIQINILGLIAHDLVEFLSNPNLRWKRLKKCPGVCVGEYFIKLGRRKYHSHKCSKATEYERDKNSGRAKARAKKHRDKIKRVKERKKKEELKEFREASKRTT